MQLAARLRKEYPAGVDVETFESYHGENARAKIHALLDTNHDGTLTPAEKQNARIILYGHSWGASEAINVARELGNDGIPVLLTIQVDSISKITENDEVIPANVAQAANFYQPDGFVHGQSAIRAADPSRTKIIGNFRFDYKTSPYTCNEYPWYDHIFVKAHTQIECDPECVETSGRPDTLKPAAGNIQQFGAVINFLRVKVRRSPVLPPTLSVSTHVTKCSKVNSCHAPYVVMCLDNGMRAPHLR